MPEPTTVWFVRAGSVEASPGRIALEGGDLVFTPHGDQEGMLRLPAARVDDARRLRGSPVLHVAAAEHPPLLFYFVKPPPLPGSGKRSVINPRRGMERTVAGMTLRNAARAKRALIDEWVRAIRAAGA